MTTAPRARIYRGTPRNLQRLARQLQQGGLVAVPSETVYGLAGNALDAGVCRKIFAAKGRPASDPLIIHIHSLAQLDQVAVANPAALQLARKFWPGPLTLILPKQPIVPAEVTAGLPSVAVRMPAHPLFRRLLKLSGLPLAAPSANPFGYVSPTTAAHVASELGRRIPSILDGGPSAIGLESTILDLRKPSHPRLLRPGAISRADLQKILRRPIGGKPKQRRDTAQVAPGLLKRHYSPRTPVFLHTRITAAQIAASRDNAAWLVLRRMPRAPVNVFALDPAGGLPAAARRLFARLRQLDAGGFTAIHVELAPSEGLGEAINDRLRRAAAR